MRFFAEFVLNPLKKYSRTLIARTRQDSRRESDPPMGLSDIWSDNFQGSSHQLYVYHGHHVFIDQSC